MQNETLFPDHVDYIPQDLVKPIKPAKPEKKKPRILYRDRPVSPRQAKYNRWLSEALSIKRDKFQTWPTHMEVQGGRVYRCAGELMTQCSEYKQSQKLKDVPSVDRGAAVSRLRNLALQNIAANIRFLESIEKNRPEGIQSPLPASLPAGHWPAINPPSKENAILIDLEKEENNAGCDQ
jgi:hypothetical protein